MYQLWVLEALNNVGDLTLARCKMSGFPMEPSIVKILITSVNYKCSAEMLTIVSMLSAPRVFYHPKEQMEEVDMARDKFKVPESNHMTLLSWVDVFPLLTLLVWEARTVTSSCHLAIMVQ
jgi:pre-mRNA-splicing factor ATP-dependent RNA helicase DHX38/PRP16